MNCELTQEEYCDILKGLRPGTFHSDTNPAGYISIYTTEDERLILLRYLPESDPSYEYKNKECTMYQLNTIPESMTREPIPVREIIIHNWKELQLVTDLLQEDKNEQHNNTTSN